jgi:O-antigen ligase
VTFLSPLIVPLLVTGPFLPDLLLSLLSFWFLYYVFKNKKYHIFKNNFFYLFLVFSLFCIFSSLMSDNIFLSFQSSLFYFRIGIFCLLISYLIDEDKNILVYFFYSLVITFSILILFALIQYTFELNKHPSRISSLFGDELILGSYLSRFLPLIIALFYIKSNKTHLEKNLFLLFVAFAYFTIFLSGERASFFYVNLSLLFILFFIRINLKLIFLFIIILIVLFLTLILNPQIQTGKNLFNRYTINVYKHMSLHSFTKIKIENQSKLLENRPNFLKSQPKIMFKNCKDDKDRFKFFTCGHESLYLTALNMFFDRPIIGHGPKMFRLKCSDPKYAEGISSCMTHPHNFYIQLLAETGVIGFSFLLCLFLYVIFLSIKYFYYSFFKKKKIYSNYHVCLLTCLLITTWPFIPNGNFFNNHLMIIYCLPLGFFKKNIKM